VFGVVGYVDWVLSGVYRDEVEDYRLGLAALDGAAKGRFGEPFADCEPRQQDALIFGLERGELTDFRIPDQRSFFWTLREHAREGLFSDPAHGGNRDKLGWKVLGHPAVWLECSADENLATEPVTRGGEIRSLADAGFSLAGATQESAEVPGYDTQKGAEPPSGPANVVLVGTAGPLVAPIFARADLKVVGLEAGSYRTRRDFVPDELSSSYYARGQWARSSSPRRRDGG
jgi:gluconate 2-dehydrogenase alpha chain